MKSSNQRFKIINQAKEKIREEIFLGIITSVLFTLSFCEITVNNTNIGLSGEAQFLTANIILVAIIALKHKKIKIFKTKTPHTYTYIAILSLYTLTSITSENFSQSFTRLILTTSTPILLILLLSSVSEIEKFLLGFSYGIFAIISISFFYSFIGLILENNYISTHTEETIKFSLFGIDFTQRIANRAFFYDGQKINIQRHAGIFPNPNGMGLISSIAFGLSYNKYLNKTIRSVVRIISALALAMSFSRMGVLCLSSIILYMGIRCVRVRVIFVVLTLSSTILSNILMSTNVMTFKLLAPLHSVLPFIHKQETLILGERGIQMTAAWVAFKENWWNGVGFGLGSEYLFPENPSTMAVHSVFVNSLLETGIFATLLLILLWIYPIIKTNRTHPTIDDQSNILHLIASLLLGIFVAEAFDLSVTRFHYIHLIFFTLLWTWFSLQQKNTQRRRTQC